MKQSNHIAFIIRALLLSVPVFTSLSCTEKGGLPPVIKFAENIYTAKAGKEITIEPAVENGEGASFEWESDGILLSTDKIFSHIFEEPGSVYIMLTVTNNSGSDSEEIRIDVASRQVPVISLNVPEGRSILGEELCFHRGKNRLVFHVAHGRQ